MRKLKSYRNLREFFQFRKTPLRHRKFTEPVTVSGETHCIATGYGISLNESPQGENARKLRKIALPVKRQGRPATE